MFSSQEVPGNTHCDVLHSSIELFKAGQENTKQWKKNKNIMNEYIKTPTATESIREHFLDHHTMLGFNSNAT